MPTDSAVRALLDFMSLEMLKATALICATLCLYFSLRRFAASTRSLVLASGMAAALLTFVLSALNRWLGVAPTWVNPLPLDLHAVSPQEVTAGTSLAWSWLSQALFAALVVWALGCVWLSSRYLVGHAVAQRRLQSVGEGPLREAFNAHLARLDLQASVRLFLHDGESLPYVVRAFRPWIVLPGSAAGWSREKLDGVLAHELAHVSRHDVAWNACGWVVRSLWWFNPLVVFTYNRWRLESEKACDDVVLAGGRAPLDYASQLLELAQAAGRRPQFAASSLPMASQSTLKARIGRMLSPHLPSTRVMRGLGWLLLVSICVAVPGLAVIQSRGGQTSALARLAAIANSTADSSSAGEDATLPRADELVDVDKEPVLLHRESPEYPEESVDQREAGIVVCRALVYKSGKVLDVVVVKSSGFDRLDQAAVKAMKNWEFSPAELAGKPVSVWINYPIKFSTGD